MKRITKVDFNLVTNAILNFLSPDLCIPQTWLSELCITLNKVVATNNKKKNPAMAMGMLLASPRNPFNISTTWPTLSSPTTLVNSENNCLLTVNLLNIKLSNCINNNKMGGSAKLVKKAVAPARRRGSFFTSNLYALTSALPIFFIFTSKLITCVLLHL